MAPRALVLGATGMLGSTLVREFDAQQIETIATARRTEAVSADVPTIAFDARADDVAVALSDVREGDYIVNCIGIIKHLMRDDDVADRHRAIDVNAAFPYRLAAAAADRGARVIQIATDCVYSGTLGGYDESSAHDATDVYGQSKSLGEVPAENMLNLRCSIIGPELGSTTSLLEWVLAHAPGSTVNGYADHFWNGVTTLAFAKVAGAVVRSGDDLAGTHHLVPADVVSKAQLVREIAGAWNRDDLIVTDVTTTHPIDRTLSTLDPDLSRRLWEHAGYPHPPRIGDMIAELSSERHRKRA